MTVFRVHFLDGTTVDVSAPDSKVARADAAARHPASPISKIKVVREATR